MKSLYLLCLLGLSTALIPRAFLMSYNETDHCGLCPMRLKYLDTNKSSEDMLVECGDYFALSCFPYEKGSDEPTEHDTGIIAIGKIKDDENYVVEESFFGIYDLTKTECYDEDEDFAPNWYMNFETIENNIFSKPADIEITDTYIQYEQVAMGGLPDDWESDGQFKCFWWAGKHYPRLMDFHDWEPVGQDYVNINTCHSMSYVDTVIKFFMESSD